MLIFRHQNRGYCLILFLLSNCQSQKIDNNIIYQLPKSISKNNISNHHKLNTHHFFSEHTVREILNQQILQFKNLDLHRKLNLYSKHFLNTPYSRNGNGDLMYRLNTLNCVTYFNTVFAASISNNYQDFEHNMMNINFYQFDNSKTKSSVINNKLNRRHFFILDTLYKHQNRFNNITSQIAKTSNCKLQINKKQFFEYVFKLKHHAIEEMNIKYALKQDLSKKDLLKLNNGVYLVTFLTNQTFKIKERFITDIDTTHVGFVIKQNDDLIIRHASSTAKKVTEIDFMKYLTLLSNNTKIAIWSID